MPVRRILPFLLLLLALGLAACGGDDKGSGSSSSSQAEATPSATATEQAEGGCRPAQPGKAKVPNPSKPSGKLPAGKTYVAQVATNCGSFEITLATKRAPKTTASFASLIKQGFYDGLTFHRIAPGFVIQGGDPKGDGTGGPGYSVEEAPPADLSYTRGVVAMAKTGTEPPGTSGSQFFIVTGEDVGLPPDYALAGRVTKGQDVVDTIGVVPSQNEQPLEPVVIDSIKLVER
jgi:cyclophilin family peptidyl-prolyl cis-trans isomerase